MSETAVDFRSVTKTYKLYERPAHQLMDNIGMGWTIPTALRPRAFPAIDNVTLSLRRGERVGLIGRNGAGKTTLLKLLIGHIKPTSGTVKTKGSIQAMMKSDLGFHMHFTGRQNILSALTYNGLWGEQAQAALADIEEFTELGAYMDQPFSSYSLGMQARLLFAVGSAVNPDILIVDEILGAGDSYFIAKSAKRMERLIDNGCTLMLVSHNTQQVLQFCDRAVWLRSGRVFDDGSARDVANAYDVYIERETTRRHGGLAASDQTDQRGQMDACNARDEFKTRLGDGKLVYRWPGHAGLKVNSIDFRVDGKPAHETQTGGNADIHFRLNIEEAGEYQCRYLLTVWSHDGWRIARIENDIDAFTGEAGGTHDITIDLSPLSLGAGRYTLNLSVYNIEGGSTAGGRLTRYDVLAHCLDFTVDDPHNLSPALYLDGQWDASTPDNVMPLERASR